jgi:hypothetical protein
VPYYAYRIVKTSTPDAEAFKSYEALGKPQPKSLPLADPDVWAGCSVLATPGQASQWARRMPHLGSFVAELLIPDGAPVRRDAANFSGHFNIWGDARLLAGYVVRVAPLPQQPGSQDV